MVIQRAGHTRFQHICWNASNGHETREICGLIIAVTILILILDGCPRFQITCTLYNLILVVHAQLGLTLCGAAGTGRCIRFLFDLIVGCTQFHATEEGTSRPRTKTAQALRDIRFDG